MLVVDNGSTDGTPDLLAELARTNPEIVVTHDPVPGKSGALNRALGLVRGRAVVFTDDDVHVPVTWFEDMAGPILDGTADGVCGKIVLASHLDRPWLTPALRTDLAEFLDVSGPAPGMVGANMATSTVAARSVGFDEELGPGERGFADDVLFNFRLKAAGYRLIGCTGPPVEHHLSPDRLNLATMQRLARSNGSSHAYVWHHWLHAELRWLRLRKWRAQLELARLRRGPAAPRRHLATRVPSSCTHRASPPSWPPSAARPATIPTARGRAPKITGAACPWAPDGPASTTGAPRGDSRYRGTVSTPRGPVPPDGTPPGRWSRPGRDGSRAAAATVPAPRTVPGTVPVRTVPGTVLQMISGDGSLDGSGDGSRTASEDSDEAPGTTHPVGTPCGSTAGCARLRPAASSTGIALGLQHALEERREQPAFVMEAPGEPEDPDAPISLHFDPDDPTKTVAVIRTPSDDARPDGSRPPARRRLTRRVRPSATRTHDAAPAPRPRSRASVA